MFLKGEMHRVLDAVLEINRDMTPRTAFFNFSGHIEGFGVTVYPNGWENDKEDSFSFSGYSDKSGRMYTTDIEHGVGVVNKNFKTLDEMLDAIRLAGKEKTHGRSEEQIRG